jgi:hypothetical protein
MKINIFILFCIVFNFAYSQDVDLLIKIPTRERPEKFFEVLDLYYSLLSGKHNVAFLISCDLDDISMNNQDVIIKFKKYKNLNFYYDYSKSKIHAYNRDIEKIKSFNILLLASDDMIPISQDYDDKIINFFNNVIGNYDAVIKFNELSNNYSELNTIPIIGHLYYKRFGYAYHPEYKSFFCDLEFTAISKILNKEYFFNESIIIHHNPIIMGVEGDNLYEKNSKFFDIDKINFLKRYKNKFDLTSDINNYRLANNAFVWIDDIVKKFLI